MKILYLYPKGDYHKIVNVPETIYEQFKKKN